MDRDQSLVVGIVHALPAFDEFLVGVPELGDDRVLVRADGGGRLARDQGIKRADHGQVEFRTDPHGIGIDQFLGDIGAGGGTAMNQGHRSKRHFWRLLSDQGLKAFGAGIAVRTVARFATCDTMQVIEAEATGAIAADRGLKDGEFLQGCPPYGIKSQ